MSRSRLESLTPEQRVQLDAFAGIVIGKGRALGMIGSNEGEHVWSRHVQDSLRALGCLGSEPIDVADLGSGAGFPGVPIAIARPDCRIFLVESRRSRVAFLEFVVEALDLSNVTVVHGSSSEVDVRVDLVLARAVASVAATWRLAQPVLKPGGAVVYFAGRSWSVVQENELAALGVSVRPCAEPDFPWEGPLVMMTLTGPAEISHRSEEG